MEGVIMKKIIGICNLHDDPHLGLLTENRPLGAVTFLGRYGLVDFTLSNFSNSHIGNVYVLVKSGIMQMRNHIGSGAIWTNNTRRGFIKLLINEKGLFAPKFNTDIANIALNLKDDNFDYAVIAPSFMLASIDYRPIVENHIKSGSDITVVYSHMRTVDDDFINCDRLTIDEKNNITKVDTYFGRGSNANISLESFVISREVLKRIVSETPHVSELYNLRQMITFMLNAGMITAHAYEYEGYVAPILSFNHYVKESFKLLDYKNKELLFSPDWPIYTTTHNTPPALYKATSQVKNSFVANGSVIKGKVIDSIISRDVLIEKGAVVKNCIIFTGSVIGENVKIENVITDKGAVISAVKDLKGDEDNMLYIKQGAKI